MEKRTVKRVGVMAAVGIGLLAGTIVAFGGAKKIIQIGADSRVEIDLENGTTTETPVKGAGVSETVSQSGGVDPAGQAAGAQTGEAAETLRIEGVVLENEGSSILLDRHFQDGYQEDVILHIDPEQTLLLDSVSGFPVAAEQIKKGDSICVYTGPAMTMSLPPQMTAVLILTGIPQDKAAPYYVHAAGSLEADGQGGWILKGADGIQIPVPADCFIEPYLTRQIVMLSDITAGRYCLVWTDVDGKAEKIVLFNE